MRLSANELVGGCLEVGGVRAGGAAACLLAAAACTHRCPCDVYSPSTLRPLQRPPIANGIGHCGEGVGRIPIDRYARSSALAAAICPRRSSAGAATRAPQPRAHGRGFLPAGGGCVHAQMSPRFVLAFNSLLRPPQRPFRQDIDRASQYADTAATFCTKLHTR